ncbi:TPA: gamma-glutamylcyclotransferase family protein [Stenotrophomonas maltophilia]|uniref:Gamma-glutamylcyclotransferase n=1 Tax=Mesopusillimonas faecipullorum TaxID=2755040 RepID=A0ABS8CCL3_9BURK|nr:gamma-glutamylcyclotransferase family protein [Mesopusillimonas faecipullorum]MCB5363768.1 gamma-glutamylcyclotransferase [Mesopusillimonas faecipullorum]MCO4018713.1 gamma-glutamylcyclotransferase [Pseudomonas aeruginosa]MDI3557827.1 gamma-glutamylcyclotransferase [Pseudomonas aeruginosa]
MPANTFLYFSYGSNMLSSRLRERCPSARPIGMAELPDHELRWHKRSKDNSGKCDVVACPGKHIIGVLYRIEDTDKTALDRAEGLGQGYEAIEAHVLHNGNNVLAKAYQATAIDESLTPYGWYKALVIAGAQEHGLPNDYVEQLKLVASTDDPDRTRHDREFRLIEGVSQ